MRTLYFKYDSFSGNWFCDEYLCSAELPLQHFKQPRPLDEMMRQVAHYLTNESDITAVFERES